MEDIQDIAACWEGLSDETFPWELIKAELAPEMVSRILDGLRKG